MYTMQKQPTLAEILDLVSNSSKQLFQASCVSIRMYVYTVSENQCHTPSREERRFLYFNHLSKEILEQMLPHLKALI